MTDVISEVVLGSFWLMLSGPNPSGHQRVNKMSQFHIVFAVAY